MVQVVTLFHTRRFPALWKIVYCRLPLFVRESDTAHVQRERKQFQRKETIKWNVQIHQPRQNRKKRTWSTRHPTPWYCRPCSRDGVVLRLGYKKIFGLHISFFLFPVADAGGPTHVRFRSLGLRRPFATHIRV